MRCLRVAPDAEITKCPPVRNIRSRNITNIRRISREYPESIRRVSREYPENIRGTSGVVTVIKHLRCDCHKVYINQVERSGCKIDDNKEFSCSVPAAAVTCMRCGLMFTAFSRCITIRLLNSGAVTGAMAPKVNHRGPTYFCPPPPLKPRRVSQTRLSPNLR